jgi:hypothetical protein
MAGEDSADCAAMYEAEELCLEIALEAFAEGMSVMTSMCGNNGQLTIINNAEGDYMECAMAAFEGEFMGFNTDHDEAVEQIIIVGDEIMAAAAAMSAIGGGESGGV